MSTRFTHRKKNVFHQLFDASINKLKYTKFSKNFISNTKNRYHIDIRIVSTFYSAPALNLRINTITEIFLPWFENCIKNYSKPSIEKQDKIPFKTYCTQHYTCWMVGYFNFMITLNWKYATFKSQYMLETFHNFLNISTKNNQLKFKYNRLNIMIYWKKPLQYN